MSSVQCRNCGQWSGKGHRCPTPTLTPPPTPRTPAIVPQPTPSSSAIDEPPTPRETPTPISSIDGIKIAPLDTNIASEQEMEEARTAIAQQAWKERVFSTEMECLSRVVARNISVDLYNETLSIEDGWNRLHEFEAVYEQWAAARGISSSKTFSQALHRPALRGLVGGVGLLLQVTPIALTPTPVTGALAVGSLALVGSAVHSAAQDHRAQLAAAVTSEQVTQRLRTMQVARDLGAYAHWEPPADFKANPRPFLD